MGASYYAVSIAGQLRLSCEDDPARVISLTINDPDEAAATASLRLDDKDGVIYLPQKNDLVSITLGRSKGGAQETFRGKVSNVTSSGGNGGRTLSVLADAADLTGKAKQPLQKSWQNKSVKDILTDAAKEAGLQPPRIDEAIGKIIRVSEVADGESYLEFAKRIGREVGGKSSLFDDLPVMTEANGGKSASGRLLVPVDVIWSDQSPNLTGWSISPKQSRFAHSAFAARYFDFEKGEVVEVEAEGQKEAKAKARSSASLKATKEEAEAAAKSDKEGAERAAGSGTITCDGNPAIFAGGLINLKGARAGVDGQYRVKSCTHTLNDSGYLCSLQVELPKGGAGKDDRKKQAATRSRSVSSREPSGYGVTFGGV